MKIYISADIEGITGVIHWNDTDKDAKGDYEYFRKVMGGEVNAAIEGAVQAGATDIIVRDAHGSALNLIPSDLDRRARLIRNWADSPFCMVEGLDSSFDAVVFIGYHAKAGTENATLKHTLTGKYRRITLNGVECSEAALNGYIAGHFGVPVAFIAGDKAICDDISHHWPQVGTVAVKEGMGDACISFHPEVNNERIRSGVCAALQRLPDISPFSLKLPCLLEVVYNKESDAARAQWFPGAIRRDAHTIHYQQNSIPECMKFLFFC